MSKWKSWTWGKVFAAVAVVLVTASSFVSGYDYVFGFCIGVSLSIGFIFWLYPYYMKSAVRNRQTILKYERELKDLWDYIGIENAGSLELRLKTPPTQDEV